MIPLPHRIAAGAAFVVILILGVLLLTAKADIRHLRKVNTGLQTKSTILEADLARQNAAIADLRAASDRRIAETERRLSEARTATATAQRRADDMLTFTPAGETACERMLDVDRRFLESLK